MIGKKFKNFTFEQMYEHGIQFMSGGVNADFHASPSIDIPDDCNNNMIDIYMLRKNEEEFPPPPMIHTLGNAATVTINDKCGDSKKCVLNFAV